MSVDCNFFDEFASARADEAANYDQKIFSKPDRIDLARSPNPHVAFGDGPHQCLGAHQARAILRLLIAVLAEETEAIEVENGVTNEERIGPFRRHAGFSSLIGWIK